MFPTGLINASPHSAGLDETGRIMRFLTTPECDDRARQAGIRPGKAGRQLTKSARHFAQLAYQSRMTNADLVAPILVDCLGTYDWAVVWAYELPGVIAPAKQNPHQTGEITPSGAYVRTNVGPCTMRLAMNSQ